VWPLLTELVPEPTSKIELPAPLILPFIFAIAEPDDLVFVICVTNKE
jgi:hypothetical protein